MLKSVLVRVLQRNRTNRMCACMCVCICVHMHVSIHLSKDVYFKESVHAVVGAAKSEICRSCWRPREKLTLQSGGRTASSLGHINLYLKTFKLIGWQLPSTLWRKSTVLKVHWFQCSSHLKNTPTPGHVFDQTSGHQSLAKLTQKMNHHKCQVRKVE